MYKDAEERKKELMAKNEMKGHMIKPGLTGMWQVSGRSDEARCSVHRLIVHLVGYPYLVSDNIRSPKKKWIKVKIYNFVEKGKN